MASSRGMTAYEREKRAMAPYRQDGLSSESTLQIKGKTEFDVLKDNLRFIREDEDPKDVSYEERVARAYESKLFKEYALIDLKHYKTHQIALRWRTAEEVIAFIGERTCASLRCPYHNPSPEQLESMSEQGLSMPRLQAFELPFTYHEAGQQKQALVKVKVCERCARKVTYKAAENKRGEKGGKAQEKNQRIRNSTNSQEEANAKRSDNRHARSANNGQTRRSESPRRR
ncbi:hypothetical protein QFC21_000116 [Naganishia friedmannii]|uniref:Uncharacterized protein n=1 Tax=Naganishia friedmannii TaxID=89922 RepID=A0ACC2WCJ5_9TREE|nr:hypothetical protein QFC21_000116 [Naganishia friedmannii]